MDYIDDEDTNAYIWKNVPKELIQQLVQNFISHPWNLNFQSQALAMYISDDKEYQYWDVAIPDGNMSNIYELELNDGRTIRPHFEGRGLEKDLNISDMLKISGHHVRVGSGGCSKIGLDIKTIKDLRKKARENNEKIKDSTYLIKDRNPILLIHLIENTTIDTQLPKYVVALGLGFPKGQEMRTAHYWVNPIELRKYIDYDWEEEDDIIC